MTQTPTGLVPQFSIRPSPEGLGYVRDTPPGLFFGGRAQLSRTEICRGGVAAAAELRSARTGETPVPTQTQAPT